MKTHWIMLAALLVSGCGSGLTDARYALDLPELPSAWASLLGEPQWRVEWLDSAGAKRTMAVHGGQRPEIALPHAWASAVSAFPYWPQRGIVPGMFRPAGAIFPFDVSGKGGARALVLSWRGGVDAALYWDMAAAVAVVGGAAANDAVANGADAAASEVAAAPENPAAAQASALRLPCNFNWPRFRELFDDPVVNAAVRADPWLADWPSIAAKTVQSGFDKRRLVPEACGELAVPVSPGPWIGASPFAAPLFFEGPPVFPVRRSADVWVSAEGLLRCNKDAWILHGWQTESY